MMTPSTRWLLLALGLPLALPGCGEPVADDDDSAVADDDDSATGDDDDDAPIAPHALVLHAPFGGDATLATIEIEGGAVTDDVLGLTGSDWGLDVADGSPWLIGRTGSDSVRRYSDLDFSAPILEFSVGANTNPQDLEVCDGKLFVSRFSLSDDGTAGGDVAAFDLATGGPLGRVDLSSYAEGTDGTPEPTDLVARNGALYVALQRLDQDNYWTPDPEGRILRIDCADLTVNGEFTVGPNPVLHALAEYGTEIIVKTDLGLEIFDFAAGTVTPGLDEADMGAGYDLVDAAFGPQGAIMAFEVDWATNELWCMGTTDPTPVLLDSFPQRNWGLHVDPNGMIWSLWRDHWATDTEVEPGGVAVYDPATCTEISPQWFSFADDPSDLVFFARP